MMKSRRSTSFCSLYIGLVSIQAKIYRARNTMVFQKGVIKECDKGCMIQGCDQGHFLVFISEMQIFYIFFKVYDRECFHP